MKNLSLLFLAVFTAWSVSVVSGDMATRKIPNSSIKTGLKLFAVFVAVFASYTLLGYAGRAQSFLNYDFYLLLAVHSLWSVLAGVALWYAEIWPAGDAKFFILVSSALPLANPYLRNFPGSLFLGLLINIFVLAALWAVGSFLASGFYSASPSDFFAEVWSDVKKRLAALSEMKSKTGTAAYLANLGVVFLLQQIFALEAGGLVGRFFSRPEILFFFMFMLWDKIGAFFSSRRWFYISVFSFAVYFIGGIFFHPEHIWRMASGAAMNVVKFSTLLFFGRFMLEFMMEKKDLQYLTIRELEPGAMLSVKTARMLRENDAFEGAFDDCFKDGLTAEQVSELREWMEKLPVDEPKIEVVRGRPFALWIFAGAVLSLLLDGNIARLLK